MNNKIWNSSDNHHINYQASWCFMYGNIYDPLFRYYDWNHVRSKHLVVQKYRSN